MPVTYSAPTVYQPPAAAPPAPPGRKVPYLPALDGLRALAVAVVLVYHGNLGALRGGFLGVEVFFVISGYLITLLLVSERQRMGGISVRRFWLRRARRLLPALYALLIVVGVVAALFLRDQLARLRGDFIAALTYTTNWYLIATDSSYFDNLGEPSLLKHLWSLAVEEQFYIVWPIFLAVVLKVFGHRLDRIAALFITMALASSILMAVLYDAGDPSRAYYGTDTRASGLILGATLALFWRPGHLARGRIGQRGPLVDIAGLMGLFVLLLFVVNVSDQDAGLYRGGFFVVGLATVAVIAAAAHPHSLLAPVLGIGILRWIGLRSYGIYLWHWPVFVLTQPDGVDVDLSPGPTFVLRIAIVLSLTEISYRLIEMPVRRGALGAWFRGLRTRNPTLRRQRVRTTAWATCILTVVVGLVGLAMARAEPQANDIQRSIIAGEAAMAAQPDLALEPGASTTVATSTVTPTSAAGATTVTATTAPAAATATATATTVAPGVTTVPAPPVPATEAPTTAQPPVPIKAVAIGDSVMLGAFNALKSVLGPESYVDAKVSRQFNVATEMVASLRNQGRLGQVVVIHLGNNGTVRSSDFDRMMEQLVDVPIVLIVNCHVARSWQDTNNAILAERSTLFPNARFLDWHGLASAHPEFFWSDSIHLRPEGAAYYAQVIGEVISQAGYELPG